MAEDNIVLLMCLDESSDDEAKISVVIQVGGKAIPIDGGASHVLRKDKVAALIAVPFDLRLTAPEDDQRVAEVMLTDPAAYRE